ncbi:EP1-like glycoprotein 3 [Cryptomeria japonica]|uniref:EP1-like glycoprotein 3 n=1 Tax=Cryptomeria japonica TaxID=3369 RepID=UPI0027D9E742|nr:EP1-like glycoprotein 3 [Cryptomeria japonica]
MVWAANGDRLVQDNATLGHTSTGDLMLNDTDGTLVWSTNAFTTGFQAMVMEESGNLVLLNGSNGTMWQSFDHPTDTLLLGQKLKVRQKLTAYISPTNTSKGFFHRSLILEGFALFNATIPPQMYFIYPWPATAVNFSFVRFDNNLLLYYSEGSPANPVAFSVSIPRDSLYLKIYYDGYLKFYSLQEKVGRVDFDKYTSVLRRCEYSTACGEYAICTGSQCECPGKDNYFLLNPSSGCTPYNPLVCSQTPTGSSRTSRYSFLELEHVSYFSYMWEKPSIVELVTGDYFALFLLLWVLFYKLGKGMQEEQNEEDLDFPAGLPVRYSFQELQKATNDFSMRLDSGGYGSI